MSIQPEWRKVPGMSDRHEVSSDGRFRSLAFTSSKGARIPDREKKVCFSKVSRKYFAGMVRVSDGGKEVVHLIHRLVASAFIGPCPDGMEVLHVDGNSRNNNASNLRYGTRSENVADAYRHGRGIQGETHPMAKLSSGQVDEIKRCLAMGDSGAQLARRYSVSPATISSIRHGTRRAAG